MKAPDFTFLKLKFLDSKYLFYLIPTVYFIVLLLMSLLNRPIGDYGVETDFYAAYVVQAKELLNGNLVIDNYRGPLYQVVLALFSVLLNSDFFLAGKLLNVISAAISLIFIMKIIALLSSKEIAFFAAILVSINHCFLKYSYTAGTDMLFLVLYVSALYFLMKDFGFGSKNLFISGILTSLAYLTRYTGISLIIFSLIIFSFSYFKKSNSITLKKVTSYFLPIIIAIVLWGGICYCKTGSFFYNMNYKNTALTVFKPENVSKDEWTLKYQNTFNSMSDVILKDVKLFSKKIFIDNFSSYFIKDITRLYPKIIGILISLGLIAFLIPFKKQNLQSKYLLLSGFLFYLQIIFIFYAERFSLPLLILYSFLILNFFVFVKFEIFNFSFGRIKLFGVILIMMIIYNFINTYYIIKNDLNSGPKEILSVKSLLKDSQKEDLKGKILMARKPHAAYYLETKFVETPYMESYAGFIETLRNKNAEYYFVNEKEADNFPDESLKKKLLNFDNPPDELEVMASTNDPVSVLYKIKR